MSTDFVKKRRIIMKAFIESQFGHSPLFWMFHTWAINNKTNRIHERALKITYSNQSSSFQDLLDRDNSVTIHRRNIRTLTIKTFKVLHGPSPSLLNKVFCGQKLQLQFTREQFLKQTKSKLSKIWYGMSFLSSFKNMGHLTKGNSERLNAFKAKIRTEFLKNALVDFVKHMYHKQDLSKKQ